ncbi:protein of unknown function [Methylorubrum extorquens DM4]|uniref:Uncharacterized protein n=1 Tax=Methylorubrum extorquens (strain DSM 6343 / CIP 106787 / DM4) TaxID=661410 RepID=C7C7C1_METED|nr:hypothetical protein [Methylorubrum extorquens]CAX25030.1 protein of unknown function [Methylorubrum extorquens DM4]
MHVPFKIVAVVRNNRVLWSATNPSQDELFDRIDTYLRRQGFEGETRVALWKAAKKGGFHVHHGEGSVEVSV